MNSDISYYIKKNLFELYSLLADNIDIELVITSEYKAIFTKESFWPNMIYDIKNLPLSLENIVHDININKIPPFCILSENIGEHEPLLEEKEFRSIISWKGMAIDISSIDIDPINNISFKISEISTIEELKLWTEIVSNELFNSKSINPKILYNSLITSNLKFYLGRLNGEPVSTCLMYINEGIAGLYMISTKNTFRNQGLGRAITLKALKDAKELNCKVGILQATPAGEKLYCNIGFKPYSNFKIFWNIGQL